MKVVIESNPKEIADLVVEVRDRLLEKPQYTCLSITIGDEKIADIIARSAVSRSTPQVI